MYELHLCSLVSLWLVFSQFGTSLFRTQLIQGRHVQAHVGTSHSTRSGFTYSIWPLLRMWALLSALLGGVATPLNHPQILPQAMIVCQWLLRMWWEREMQAVLQDNPFVSWFAEQNFPRTTISCITENVYHGLNFRGLNFHSKQVLTHEI